MANTSFIQQILLSAYNDPGPVTGAEDKDVSKTRPTLVLPACPLVVDHVYDRTLILECYTATVKKVCKEKFIKQPRHNVIAS